MMLSARESSEKDIGNICVEWFATLKEVVIVVITQCNIQMMYHRVVHLQPI